MEILKLFIKFVNEILSYEIFDIQLITYLLSFTMVITIFKIISIIGNNGTSKNKKENKESSDK